MPLHFLWGDEDFLIERSTKKIIEQTLGSDVNELNYRAIDNPSFVQFSELLRTNATMFGPSVIKIKCPNFFLEQKDKEKLDDKQNNELINAVKNISDMVTIILVCPIKRGEKKKPDSRKKLYKEIQKIAKIEECQNIPSYKEAQLFPQINAIARELDLKIGNAEVSFLIQTTGTYLRDLYTQMEKFKLYAYPENIVTIDMIKEVASTNFQVLQVVDYLLEKKNIEALQVISELLLKENYLPILAFINTVITNSLKIKIYLENNMNSYEIASKTGQMEFLVSKTIKKLKTITLNELIQLKINLTEIDYKLKVGELSEPMLAFEAAFLGGNLC